jgi:hypothetical protein
MAEATKLDLKKQFKHLYLELSPRRPRVAQPRNDSTTIGYVPYARGLGTRSPEEPKGWCVMDRRVVGVALVFFVGVALLLAGCGAQVGATQQILVDEPLASAAVTEVRLVMGDGKLVLAPGAAGLVSGTIDLNVAAWKPKITRSDTRLTIAQGSTKGLSGGDATVVNDWNLKLGVAPMRLQIEAGAYEGAFELGGLSLQALDVTDGAAKTQINFTSPNPSQMERLRYVTGASTVTLVGLANANPAAMEFSGAAGTYVLDFSGQLRSDAKVEITVYR